MPVIPEFSPQGTPGGVLEGSQNLMMRAAENRRQQEAAAMEKEKFDILRPVMLAEQRAKLAQEGSNYVVTKQMSDFIAKAAEKWPSIVQEWNDASLIDDANERIGVRRQVLAKASGLSGVKGYSDTIQAWQKQYADDALADKTADTLQNKLDVTGAQNEGKLAVKEKDLAIREAQIAAQQERFKLQQEHAKALEEEKAMHAQELEAIKGQNAKGVAEARGAGTRVAAREKEVGKINDTLLQEASAASSDLSRFQTAVQLLNDPNVRTGTLAGAENAIRRFGTEFGLDVSKVSKTEELQAILGSTFLPLAKDLKGNLSDKDRESLQKISPDITKTPEGNLALVNFLIARRERDLAIADIIAEGRRAGDDERAIQLDVYDYVRSNPLRPPQAASGKPSASSPSPAVPTWSPDKERELQELKAKLGR